MYVWTILTWTRHSVARKLLPLPVITKMWGSAVLGIGATFRNLLSIRRELPQTRYLILQLCLSRSHLATITAQRYEKTELCLPSTANSSCKDYSSMLRLTFWTQLPSEQGRISQQIQLSGPHISREATVPAFTLLGRRRMRKLGSLTLCGSGRWDTFQKHCGTKFQAYHHIRLFHHPDSTVRRPDYSGWQRE